MRTLEINKSKLWYVGPDKIEIEMKDEDGYFTGEVRLEYEEPKEIRLHLYPATSEVKLESFGTTSSIDMVTSATDMILEENGYLFLEEPIGDYELTYDYKVDKILPSLNFYQYGLRGNI